MKRGIPKRKETLKGYFEPKKSRAVKIEFHPIRAPTPEQMKLIFAKEGMPSGLAGAGIGNYYIIFITN